MKVPDVHILFTGIGGQIINIIILTNEKHLVISRLEFFTVFTFCESKDGNYWQVVTILKQ